MIIAMLVLIVVAVLGCLWIYRSVTCPRMVQPDYKAIDEASDYLGVDHCVIKSNGKAYITWSDKEYDLLDVYAMKQEGK